MNKAVMARIVTMGICVSTFVKKVKGKDWTKEEWKKEKGSNGWVFPHIDKSTTGKVTAEEY